ncbi:MAG: polyphosphate kinase 2 family protein [Melioribacteraceae bacterium]|nr:polyphosphate kinase 2 family protein [Melioribacteraceae bacterium]
MEIKPDQFKAEYKNFSLKKFKTEMDFDLKKDDGKKLLDQNIQKLTELQDKLYAYDKYAMLLIFQGMDAAGKDGAIKHVMSGLNPQGVQVFSFKQPSSEEMDHDYLWRINKSLPERGRIGIFNRSHYEDVLIVRVHDLLKYRKLPQKFVTENIWKNRFEQIRNFEEYLYKNGIVTLKFFLHISKDEQKGRFIKRLEDKSKNWKFSASDLKERKYWDDYQKCFEDAINFTSTKYAPWYIIPADKKWFARYIISEIIVEEMQKLKLAYPKLNQEQQKQIEIYKEELKKQDA